MKELEILIIHLNGTEVIINCLKSIFADDASAKVTILFNATTDKSIEVVGKKFPQVKFYITHERLGFAQASNFLAMQSKAKQIIFLNNDLIVSKNWANEMIKTLKAHSKCIGVQSKVKSFYNRNYFENAGAAGGFIDKYGYPFCRGRIFDNVEKDKGQYDDETRIFWGCGVSFLVNRDEFIKRGMFDEKFFMYAEELDFCWRTNNQGMEIWYSPKSVVYHMGSFSVNYEKINFKKEYYITRNHILAFLKNYSMFNILKLLPTRLMLELISALRFPLKRGIPFVLSLPNIIYYFIQRKNIIKSKLFSEKSNLNNLIYPQSIAMEYFIKHKKTFKDLEFGE
ncbi:glycosyltransferase family 2 protein [Candidatus Pacearchaeota archaeon]|nr:glycosyltransferase family 2 protein [Candidatus Pacearchaeota archaeon]